MRRSAAAVGLGAALLPACARVAPVSRPSPDGQARVYEVAALRFEAPGDWRAEGDPRKVKLTSPAGDGVVEARAIEASGPPAACLARAEESLSRGAVGLDGVRRHPSSFAGQKAVAQEADARGWHGWAWAMCAGGEQYRVSVSGKAPVSREVVDVQRRVVATAHLGRAP